MTLTTVCLGYFMASWAMGPIAAILPTITDDLGLSVAAAGWIMTGYFLMLVGSVLLMGRLGDMLGQQRIFSTGVALFTAAGVLCGLSNSYGLLLVARGLQGIASAMIFGTSLAIITFAVPARARGRAIGCLIIASSLSSLAGVWLNTWSVQHLTWHWAFIFPTPAGLVGTVLGLRLGLRPGPSRPWRMDWAGAGLLFATLTAGMLALNHLHEGGETFEAGGPYHLGMHAVTLLLLIALVRVERRCRWPLVTLTSLRNREFSAGVIANGIAHMSMLATGFLMPFLLERGRSLTPTETGQFMMGQQVAMVGSSVAFGYLYDRVRSPFIGAAMLGGISGGLLLLGLSGGGLPFVVLITIGVVLGAGLGGFTTVNNTAVMSLAPEGQYGFTSGLIESTRQLGHAVGVSLSSSFMAAALAGVTAPGAGQYIDGFQQAALAMGLVSTTGLAVLLWPRLASGHLRPVGARARSTVGLSE